MSLICGFRQQQDKRAHIGQQLLLNVTNTSEVCVHGCCQCACLPEGQPFQHLSNLPHISKLGGGEK